MERRFLQWKVETANDTLHARVKQGCLFATTFLVMLWVTNARYILEYTRKKPKERDKKVRVRLR